MADFVTSRLLDIDSLNEMLVNLGKQKLREEALIYFWIFSPRRWKMDEQIFQYNHL